MQVLNIGSGPGRDIKEYFDNHPAANVYIECIELDEKAITYSKGLCEKYLNRVHFQQKNIFRFKSDKKYDLIWSAGLFDYFTDKQFVKILTRLQKYAKTNSEVVVGNFSTNHPSKTYMEKVGKWFLNHRDKNTLVELAIKSGAKKDSVFVSSEDEGVNLFLHIITP